MINKDELLLLSEVLGELCEHWKPFPYQKKILDDLFLKKKKEVFCNLHRKGGKTELGILFLVARAQMRPDSTLYFVSFKQENARHVAWSRFKRMIPEKWLIPGGIKETALELHFTNGSIIYLLGSSMDPDALIGTEPDFIVYDEFRKHKPEFHDVMSPNQFKKHFQALYISTPPDLLEVEDGRCKFYKDKEDYCDKTVACSFHSVSCWEGNPTLQEFFKQEQRKYQMAGRTAEFQREYEAKYVKGTSDTILPEFNHDQLVPHVDVMRMIDGRSDLIWMVSCDTSGGARWGALFVCIDKRSKEVFVLDKITIRSLGKSLEDRDGVGMSGEKWWPPIEGKMRELLPQSKREDWEIIWDCQDIPVMDDVRRWHGKDLIIYPVNKNKMTKMESLGLIRDLKTFNKLIISSRASELVDEFKSYKLNPKTEKPYKKYDELIDCFRYALYEHEYLFDREQLQIKVDVPETAQEKQERILEQTRRILAEPSDFIVEDDFL